MSILKVCKLRFHVFVFSFVLVDDAFVFLWIILFLFLLVTLYYNAQAVLGTIIRIPTLQKLE